MINIKTRSRPHWGVQGAKGVWGGPQLCGKGRQKLLVFCKVRHIAQKDIWENKNPHPPHGWGVQGANGVWGVCQLCGYGRQRLLVFSKVRKITQNDIWKNKNTHPPHGWGVQGAKGVQGGPMVKADRDFQLL